MKKWKSVTEVHEHALSAVDKPIKSLVLSETLAKYELSPQNKGWIGNAIENDWFGIPNNNRNEADIPYLGLEIKVTPIKKTKNGWSAKERLVLNIFDFHEEYKKDFLNSSFLKKANLIEMMYYEFISGKPSPDLVIKAATLLNLHDLPEEDILIIEQDWNIIVEKIKAGKAEELSDSLTKYLGATTKGSKSEKNMTTQPFSDAKAHRRSFTLKGSYMSQVARKVMSQEKEQSEKVIKNTKELKTKSFEEVLTDKFKPFLGKSKVELAELFNVHISTKDDKASSAILAKKMLNLNSNIQDTEEFKKADISVKIVTVETGKKKTTEGFKVLIPNQNTIDPELLIEEEWETSLLNEYLSNYQFMLVIFEKKEEETIFKGIKFWHIPYKDLQCDIRNTWEETKRVFQEGLTLRYNKRSKPTSTGKTYYIENNLPKQSSTTVLHVRPSAGVSKYFDDGINVMRLPIRSKWINRPNHLMGELTDYYITKQAWWLNKDYMYSQVKEFFSLQLD
ncbi:Sau3AI family type II restriction endonuclease [Marinilactibacillus psychrotolerans]|uniref:Sau3AI family type II restriction endonuclease n=1 Tax=Marinilactibacillus psychrotolerans TaxID=191770 RepID=UPI0038840B80